MNKIILIILLTLVTLPSFAQDVRTDLQKHFKDFNLVKLDKTEIILPILSEVKKQITH